MDEALRALERARDQEAALPHALGLARAGRVREALERLERPDLRPDDLAEATALQDALWREELRRLTPVGGLEGPAAWLTEQAFDLGSELLGAVHMGEVQLHDARTGALLHRHEAVPMADLARGYGSHSPHLQAARGRLFFDGLQGITSLGRAADGALEQLGPEIPGATLLAVDPAGERVLVGFDLGPRLQLRWPRGRARPRWVLVEWPSLRELEGGDANYGTPLADWGGGHLLLRAAGERIEALPLAGAAPRAGFDARGALQLLGPGVVAELEPGKGLVLHGPGWRRRVVERGQVESVSLAADGRGLRLQAGGLAVRHALDPKTGLTARTRWGTAAPGPARWHPRADLRELGQEAEAATTTLEGEPVVPHPGAALLEWAPAGRAALFAREGEALELWRIPD